MMIHRRVLRFISSLFFAFLFCLGHSQDIHFTLHHMTPLAFNPANTGAFYGSYRLSGLYRDQYRSVAGKGAYMTPTFSVDAPIIRGFKETDWVGVGLFFYSDKSGTIGLTQSSFKVSAAYHLALNKNGNQVLSIAYQTGPVQREVKNAQDLRLEDELTGMIETSPDRDALLNAGKKGFLDHVGGLKFTSKFNKTDEWSIGIAAGKFGRENWALLSSGSYIVEPRIHGQVGFSTVMSDKMRLSPSISYQKVMKSAASTLVAQGHIDYLFNPATNTILKAGLGYRSGANVGDAIQIMVGTEIKGINLMLGYDFNVSSLSAASSGAGGFELSAQYIGRIYKRPNPDPVIFCPRF